MRRLALVVALVLGTIAATGVVAPLDMAPAARAAADTGPWTLSLTINGQLVYTSVPFAMEEAVLKQHVDFMNGVYAKYKLNQQLSYARAQ